MILELKKYVALGNETAKDGSGSSDNDIEEHELEDNDEDNVQEVLEPNS